MFQKAERKKSKLRLALIGPSGSGKTQSALLIAKGLGAKKIAVIDTEHGSASLYSDIADFFVYEMTPPFNSQKYEQAIKYAEKEGFDCIIIDSLSHCWAGEGGLLEMQSKIAEKPGKNSYTSWAEITPIYNHLIAVIQSSSCHIIATMRSKTEYAMIQKDDKKTKIEKIGSAPIQRDGMEYEFTVVFDLDTAHNVNCSKDRTGMFDKKSFIPSEETGKKLIDWLNKGIELPPIQMITEEQITRIKNSSAKLESILSYFKVEKLEDLTLEQADIVINQLKD